MPTIHRAYLGTAAATASLPFFLEDPVKYKWLALVIGLGLFVTLDDILYHLGLPCFLCKIIPE